jgi:hypothetical protein
VVTGNGGNGIDVSEYDPGDTNRIRNCIIADNGGRGIYCLQTGSLNPLIANCVLTSNDSSGLYCYNASPVLRFCTICRNSAQDGGGIYCANRSSPLVDSSTICENHAAGDGDGVYTTDNSWPIFSHCNILKNGWGIYNNDNSQMLQAPNVWWGDSTGPWHPSYNPTGRGDSVSQFVDPLPYLTKGDTTGAPPIPPMGVDTPEVGGDSITVAWAPSTTGRLAGYRVYYDTDTSGFPYAESVDVGLDTTYTIHHTTDGAVTYYIAVTCYDSLEKESWYSKEISATINFTGEKEQLPRIPKGAALYPASPNPFRATTVIRYALPHDAAVTLVVYDAAGRRVRTLARCREKAGDHSVVWAGTDADGRLVSRGAYFCRLTTPNGYSAIRKTLFQ